MGDAAGNMITFDAIRTFAKAAFGECAVTKPADGVFTVLAQLEIGSTSGSTTYVAASSSAIDFGAQVRVYGSSTFTAGTLSATGSPFAGATLSFSGAEVTATGQGEFFSLFNSSSSPDIPDGKLELYDTIVLHKSAGSTSPSPESAPRLRHGFCPRLPRTRKSSGISPARFSRRTGPLKSKRRFSSPIRRCRPSGCGPCRNPHGAGRRLRTAGCR